jgi:hypothetical protein
MLSKRTPVANGEGRPRRRPGRVSTRADLRTAARTNERHGIAASVSHLQSWFRIAQSSYHTTLSGQVRRNATYRLLHSQ